MRFIALFCLFLALVSCSDRGGATLGHELTRAVPAYAHFLQKQSMASEAPTIIAEVSQSERLWLQSAEPRRADVLLKAAPNWLDLGSPSISAPAFSQIQALLPQLATNGVNGVYLGEIGEKPDIWLNLGGTNPPSNSASFHFAANFGSDEDFEKLSDQAESLGIELGTALLPGATGIGPDFILQARHVPGYTGIYAMLPQVSHTLTGVPALYSKTNTSDKHRSQRESQPLHAEDSPNNKEWQIRPLSQDGVSNLVSEGIIPQTISRDKLPWASAGGWASTGPILGADGVARSWIYRYSGTPYQPILAWADPSGAAAKIFAAAIIRAVGLFRQTLVGLHFEPLLALEPGIAAAFPSLSPGMDALNAISRQAHRYGGWTLQADAVPASVIESVLNGATDFCRDDVTLALVLFGFLEADGRPVASLYRRWINQNLDINRLARGLENRGLELRILLDQWCQQAERLRNLGSNNNIDASVLSAHFGQAVARNWEKFRTVWQLGLPGIAFITTPLEADTWLVNTLKARKSCGLAQGKVLEVIRGHGGGFGLLSQLPAGGYWLLACNFGLHDDSLSVTLPTAVKTARDAGTAKNLAVFGRNFHIDLDGRVALNVLFVE